MVCSSWVFSSLINLEGDETTAAKPHCNSPHQKTGIFLVKIEIHFSVSLRYMDNAWFSPHAKHLPKARQYRCQAAVSRESDGQEDRRRKG
jgi:hypothetical protein